MLRDNYHENFEATTPGGVLNRNKNAEVKTSKIFLKIHYIGVKIDEEQVGTIILMSNSLEIFEFSMLKIDRI
jgi:hypothetical protein